MNTHLGNAKSRWAVAQISNLLYRRFAIGGATANLNASDDAAALQDATLRNGRLQICATSSADYRRTRLTQLRKTSIPPPRCHWPFAIQTELVDDLSIDIDRLDMAAISLKCDDVDVIDGLGAREVPGF